jgi:hypothetical protein
MNIYLEVLISSCVVHYRSEELPWKYLQYFLQRVHDRERLCLGLFRAAEDDHEALSQRCEGLGGSIPPPGPAKINGL